jgi:hypothetical protein
MDQKIGPSPVGHDLLKELADNRNKAELMRLMAESTHGEVRRLYLQIADSFSHTASMLEALKRALNSNYETL